jgi:hypothetical protein
VNKCIVNAVDVNGVEDDKGEVGDILLDGFGGVGRDFDECQLDGGAEDLVFLVVEAEEVDEEGELGLLEVVEDVEVLLVIVDFAGEEFEEVDKVGFVIIIKVIVGSEVPLLVNRHDQIGILLILGDGSQKVLKRREDDFDDFASKLVLFHFFE